MQTGLACVNTMKTMQLILVLCLLVEWVMSSPVMRRHRHRKTDMDENGADCPFSRRLSDAPNTRNTGISRQCLDSIRHATDGFRLYNLTQDYYRECRWAVGDQPQSDLEKAWKHCSKRRECADRCVEVVLNQRFVNLAMDECPRARCKDYAQFHYRLVNKSCSESDLSAFTESVDDGLALRMANNRS